MRKLWRGSTIIRSLFFPAFRSVSPDEDHYDDADSGHDARCYEIDDDDDHDDDDGHQDDDDDDDGDRGGDGGDDDDDNDDDSK